MNTTETKKTENTMNTKIRFMYNGIKIGTKLERADFSLIEAWIMSNGREVPTQLVIYGKEYQGFSAAVREAFDVQNNSDYMTDYFENDKIRVLPNHPRFADVAEAAMKSLRKDITRCEKTGKTEAVNHYRSELEKIENLVASL